MKILVVDDELDIVPLFRQKFRKELRQNIVQFHFVHSAEEALDYLSTAADSEAVLILSDINMPGMNGLELLKIIKAEYNHLNVYMITAYDEESNYKKAMDYGADKYLTKPIDFEKLKAEIFTK